jgi:hypothetical protein
MCERKGGFYTTSGHLKEERVTGYLVSRTSSSSKLVNYKE